MLPASTETFVPLFEINGSPPAVRPVRLRLGAADLPVRSLREWGNGGPAIGPSASNASSAASPAPPPVSGPSAGTPAVPHSPASSPSPAQPMLTVYRDGDRVVALQIRCRCGEVMNLVCAYEEGCREASMPSSSAPGTGGA